MEPPREKAPLPTEGLDAGRLSPALRACLELIHLKQIYRRGWLLRGLPPGRCESVAEHGLGVALLALLLGDAAGDGVDRERLVSMALVHDLGEVHAGDLTPADGVAEEEKHAREEASLGRVLEGVPGAERWLALWRDYAEGRSPEARLLRQLDRLEMGLQALVHERRGELDGGEFLASADAALEAPPLRSLFRELLALRP
jgi:putative hydrolase of HD superfamily